MAKLTVVPTPVGNLEDMTFRAIRVLKEADLILAEDTRTTGILLKHFEIQNKMQSHHKFNEHKTVEQIASKAAKTSHSYPTPGHRPSPTRALCSSGNVCGRVSTWNVCREQPHLFRPSWPPGYRTKSFVSKDSFPRRKVVRPA